MARPTKLTPEIQKKIGDNIALGLSYSLAANAAGITYQTFNFWISKGKNSTSGRYFEFYKHIQQRNAEGALKLLENLNAAAKAGDMRICRWILERRFSEDFGRRVYRRRNAISENLNQNVEIIVNDADGIRKEILAKFTLIREMHDSPIV
jgi:abortive infection bacteriophage resistance protein